MLTVEDIADFTWSYGKEFFLEVDGPWNYVWSDPDYGGDGTIRKFSGNYKDWCKQIGIPFGRSKGIHQIKGYCGEEVKIID